MPQAAPINFFAQQDPSFVAQQLLAARQQKMADMLTQEGSTPIQYDPHGLISPLQGLAKMLQAYEGGKMSKDAISKQSELQAQSARMMAQAYGMGDPSQPAPSAPQDPQFAAGQAALAQTSQGGGQPGPTTSTAALADALVPQMATQAPAQQQSTQQGNGSSPMNPYGVPPLLAWAASQGDPAALEQMKFYLAGKQLTEQQKNDAAAGVTPAQRNALVTQETVKPNNTIVGRNPDGSIKTMYVAPDVEGNVQSTVGPNGQITAAGVPGVVPAQAALAAGLANAKARNTIGTVKDASGADVPAWMGSAADTGTAQLGLGGNGPPAPGAPPTGGYPAPTGPTSWTGTALPPAALQQLQVKAQQGDPEAQAALAGYAQKFGGGQQQTAPQLGISPAQQTAQNNLQTSMAAKWQLLNDAAANAQTINSRLDTIKDLSTKASTGQMADKVQFANSLLSLAGSDRATDTNTAKVLIDKNASQIVAQLGQGGLGTDAARAILQSAYPNSRMPAPAIAEAADNLKAANSMLVAKANVLQPHYTQGDPVGYQQKESTFNAVADPRVFQWKAMASNPTAQKAFAAKLVQQDPTMPAKINALEQMGAFK